MLKFIILVGILYVVYHLFFKKPIITATKKSDMKKDSETMVECNNCKAFVSVNEAFIVDGKYFCSKECVDAYTRT